MFMASASRMSSRTRPVTSAEMRSFSKAASVAGRTASEIRKVIVASTKAMTDAASTPTRAWFCASSSSIARSTTNSEMVNQIPHSVARRRSRSVR
jgi:hypothetical protein